MPDEAEEKTRAINARLRVSLPWLRVTVREVRDLIRGWSAEAKAIESAASRIGNVDYAKIMRGKGGSDA